MPPAPGDGILCISNRELKVAAADALRFIKPPQSISNRELKDSYNLWRMVTPPWAASQIEN